jgi:hypothetical protein
VWVQPGLEAPDARPAGQNPMTHRFCTARLHETAPSLASLLLGQTVAMLMMLPPLLPPQRPSSSQCAAYPPLDHWTAAIATATASF